MALQILFYLFSSLLLISALTVVLTKNTIYGALALIVSFFNAGALLLLIGAEFISFMIMIVYVGAVAVLFLFVVMMLNIKFSSIRQAIGNYRYAVIFVVLLIAAQILILLINFKVSSLALDQIVFPRPKQTENIVALGSILYTDYVLIFQMAGLILFIAMIGALVLTEGSSPSYFYRKQKKEEQLKRTKNESLALIDPGKHQGVIPGKLCKIEEVKE